MLKETLLKENLRVNGQKTEKPKLNKAGEKMKRYGEKLRS